MSDLLYNKGGIMNIEVKVDKRTELLGVIMLLSKYNEKYPQLLEECNNKEYREKVFETFDKYKNEKAIKLFNKIINKLSFNYDAPVSLFLQLNEDFSYDELDVYPFYNRLGQSPIVLDFLKELPSFSKKINFEEYYKSNKDFYMSIIQSSKERIFADSIDSFMNYFYKIDLSDRKFIINLMPYGTRGNYGTHFKNTVCSNVGLKGGESITFIEEDDFGTLPLHEFSHSIINPLTDKYSDISNEFFSDIMGIMSKKAYGATNTIINEHVIRSIEIVYLRKFLKENKVADCEQVRQNKRGFKYIDFCVEQLEKYFDNVDKYKDFEEFYPTFLSNFKQLNEKEEIDCEKE